MSLDLQSKQFNFPKNVQTAIKMLGGKDTIKNDGVVDLGDFMNFSRSFPVAFYPIMNVQKNVREQTLGHRYWARIVARRMKIDVLVSYMRRNFGALPLLTWQDHWWSLLPWNDLDFIRKRASEIYAGELKVRRRIGAGDGDDDDDDDDDDAS